MSKFKALLGTIRPPFLILTPACVFLGYGTAAWTSESVSVYHLLLAFIGAIAAHISVNALNEYSDFRSGLDLRTKPTPFSGGSGTLPDHPEIASLTQITGLLTWAIAVLVGLYFILIRGLMLLPLGLVGLFLILAYTKWLTRVPLLSLFAPGLGMGTLMVMGTDFALTGQFTRTSLVASFVPFFTVNNLLLLNQFPDIEADRSIGRRHFPVTIGTKRSAVIYAIFSVFAYLSIILGVLLGYLPAASLLGLISLLLAVPTVVGAFRYSEDIGKLMPYLGLNVMITIFTPVLVAIGLLVG